MSSSNEPQADLAQRPDETTGEGTPMPLTESPTALDSIPTDNRPELSVDEAMERIRKGELIQNVTIHRLRFRGEFDQPVRLKNCTLIRPIFDGATFHGDVQFSGCKLDRLTFNRKTICEKNLEFNFATINKILIRDLTVQGKFNLMNLHACGKFQIISSRFEGQVFAWEANFADWVDIKKSHFSGEVDLRSTQFHQGFSISQRCRFDGPVLLRGAMISKKFDPGDTYFGSMLDLSKAKLHDFVYLDNIEQGEGMRFAIWNALAERVRVRPDQLEGRIQSEENEDYERAMQEYGVLKRSFESLNLHDQEDWAFYRFKVNQRRGCGRSWVRPWTKLAQFGNWLFLDLGCGYGTNPMRAVRAAVVIILIFAAIFALGYQQFYVERIPFTDQAPDSWPNRIMHGLLTSVAVFTSGMGDVRDVAKGWMNVPIILESLLGTLLFGLFIVAFSRKVIR